MTQRRFKGINDMYHFGVDAEEEERMKQRYGRNYMTINFEINESFNRQNRKPQPFGKLMIANKEIPITISEANKVIETLEDAVLIFRRKQRLGI